MKNFALIGANSGWGGRVRSVERGPVDLDKSGLLDHLRSHGVSVEYFEQLYPALLSEDSNISSKDALPRVLDICTQLAKSVAQTLNEELFPIVLGGDHSIAVGTWSGVVTQKKIPEKMGLIWIDAHCDAHTPETSPSQNYHGMPVAALMGYGPKPWSQFLDIVKKVRPEHIVQIGIRSYESEEYALLKKLGAKIYDMDFVERHSFKNTFEEAYDYLSKYTEGIGISFDVDSLDPVYAPGVATPEPEGLNPIEVLTTLKSIVHRPNILALELVEYNPDADVDHKTRLLIFQILETLLKPQLTLL